MMNRNIKPLRNHHKESHMTTTVTKQGAPLWKKALLFALLPMVLVLAGCNLDAKVNVTDDGKATATYRITGEKGAENSIEFSDCQQAYTMLRNVNILDEDSKTEDNSTKTNLDCTAVWQMKPDRDYTIKKADKNKKLTIKLNSDIGGQAMTVGKIKLTVTVPGKVLDASAGKIKENTVTVTSKEALNKDLVITYDSKSNAPVIIGLIIVVIILVVAVIIVLVRKRKKKNAEETEHKHVSSPTEQVIPAQSTLEEPPAEATAPNDVPTEEPPSTVEQPEEQESPAEDLPSGADNNKPHFPPRRENR